MIRLTTKGNYGEEKVFEGRTMQEIYNQLVDAKLIDEENDCPLERETFEYYGIDYDSFVSIGDEMEDAQQEMARKIYEAFRPLPEDALRDVIAKYANVRSCSFTYSFEATYDDTNQTVVIWVFAEDKEDAFDSAVEEFANLLCLDGPEEVEKAYITIKDF